MAILLFRRFDRDPAAESITPRISRAKFFRSRRNLAVGLLAAFFFGQVGVAAAGSASEFRWAGDPEGGAPFVEADPMHPDRLVGFDVEIAELIARKLNREPRFVNINFTSIDQSIERGDAEVGLSGIEDTPARRSTMAPTIPYYEFREVLSVRSADRERFRSLADLKGRPVGTLGGTIAYEILLNAQREFDIRPVSYDDDVHPYSDLVIGRIDAVLLDNVLAERRVRALSGFAVQPQSVATGHYVGLLAARNSALRDQINEILRDAMRDGALEKIFRYWRVWNDDQARLHARVLAAESLPAVSGVEAPVILTAWQATLRYLPSLLQAAVVTIVLSCLAMALAIVLGISIATGRVYGNPLVRTLLTGYVEIMRGTPILLQLFVLYYGIAELIRLPAFGAALLGLGLNYAAYESEIYRGALQAVPVGQLEAARILGLSEGRVLSLVRGPLALRLALAPMTNDFIALLKDSSLVSVLTVFELTKQTQIFATNIGSWVVPGLLCAALYLAMSLPLATLARRLEHRWRLSAV
ncbi:MAG TPA: ABC transporter permease subunit [Bryobacteraceae bacterium]|jgi:polar amino acid transport system substrate-binding protein